MTRQHPTNIMNRSFRATSYIGGLSITRESRIPSAPDREWKAAPLLRWRKKQVCWEASCGLVVVWVYLRTARSGPFLSFHLNQPVVPVSGRIPPGSRQIVLQQCWLPDEITDRCETEDEKNASLKRLAEVFLARWHRRCRAQLPKRQRRTAKV